MDRWKTLTAKTGETIADFEEANVIGRMWLGANKGNAKTQPRGANGPTDRPNSQKIRISYQDQPPVGNNKVGPYLIFLFQCLKTCDQIMHH